MKFDLTKHPKPARLPLAIMAEPGTYSEKLTTGGTLEVTANSFRIRYYFAGPDGRSRGTFVDVDGPKLESYVAAFQDNWKEFLSLKATIPAGGEFQKAGKLGMQLRISAFNEGVCIHAYHMPLSTADMVQNVIDTYRYVVTRAAKARVFLAAMQDRTA